MSILARFFLLWALISFCAVALPDVASARTVNLPGTVHDFCGIGFSPATCPTGFTPHPDFENTTISDDLGLVATRLGDDSAPVPAGIFPHPTVQSAASFNQWFHSTPGINKPSSITLTMTETPPGSGIYVYDNPAFLPIDGQLLGNQGQAHNYSFTLQLHTPFTFRPGQYVKVAGDDDIWVFINNQGVIDLGGVHPSEGDYVSLDTLGLKAGEKYTFDLFFAERHTIDSHLTLETNIVFEIP